MCRAGGRLCGRCGCPASLGRNQTIATTGPAKDQVKYHMLHRNGPKNEEDREGEHSDVAAMNAHELARLLREAKLEAYVLHTKFSSVVTVGQYDSLEDPNLRAMQILIKTRLNLTITQLFPTPVPMQVPR